MKLITQKHNKLGYLALLVMALITAVIGLVYSQPVFYLVTVVLICLALFRRYWLGKRLK